MANTDDRLLRRYLLGTLTEEERERAEERLLRDTGVLEDLDEETDSLVEEFLSGALSPPERTQFEHHFLACAPHREQLTASRALRQHAFAQLARTEPAAPAFVDARASAGSSRPRWRPVLPAAAAAAAALLAVMSWHQTREGGSAPRPDARPVPPATVAPSPAAGAEPGPTLDVSVILRLLPGQTMSAGAPRAQAVLGPSTTRVRLELVLEQDRFDTYEAQVSADGRELWRASTTPRRTAAGSAVVLDVPAPRIAAATDCRVRLSGRRPGGALQPVASYSFRLLQSP